MKNYRTNEELQNKVKQNNLLEQENNMFKRENQELKEKYSFLNRNVDSFLKTTTNVQDQNKKQLQTIQEQYSLIQKLQQIIHENKMAAIKNQSQ